MNTEKNVLIVLPPKDFREEEFFTPKSAFENAGIGVKVASSAAGECFGVSGKLAIADLNFTEVNSIDFDAIVFIGGPGVEVFFADEAVLSLANEFNNAGKIVGAICWAPVILANAGIIKGKKITVWDGAKNEIENAGASYTGEIATVDGNIVTANGPEASEEFASKIIEVLHN